MQLVPAAATPAAARVDEDDNDEDRGNGI